MSSLRNQLQAIYERHGALTPTTVVDEARDPRHPLHARFEWNDALAGEKWRHVQAQELIRSVKIVRSDSDPAQNELRAFQAVRRPTGYQYEPVEEIVQDEMASRLLLQDMEREWRALKRRYEQFSEFRQLVLNDLNAA